MRTMRGSVATRVLAGVVVLAALAGGAYWWWTRREPPPPPPAAARPQPPAPIAPQGPKHPLPAVEEKPLPRLAESDATVLESLSSLLGPDTVRRFFFAEDVIRRIVVTVDNLPRKTFAARLNPVRGPEGLPKTTGSNATLALAADNSARYAPYVRALEAVDTGRIVELYRRLYPLFQEAYVEQGYPNGYFNDRLVEVIDHLLATPKVAGPVKLTVPHVLYEYADPALEDLSAGQKLMIRMGPDNAARVKAKLAAIRERVSAPAPAR